MSDLFPNTTVINAGFADFWALLPAGAKSGKVSAEKAYKRLTPPRRKEARENVAAYYDWWRKQNPQASWLHPSTYLNQRRWEDEAFSPPPSAPQDRAAYWADQINAGRPISRFSVTPTLCEEMVSRDLVSRDILRERGLG
jgi:hypothetical protein